MKRNWTNTEINYLKQNYETTEKDILLKSINRTWSSVRQKAKLLNLERSEGILLNANAYKLINGSNEAYYWLGFIMADGHFNKNHQLQINLSKNDINHLKLFANFVEYKGFLIKPKISIGIKNIFKELNDIFNISNNKTYNPCDLSKLKEDKFFSFIIGFIDGDGYIDNRGYLTIKCHSSWLNNLNLMIEFLSQNNFNKGKINSEGLALVHLSNIEIMNQIKIKIENLNLPFLKRKWEKIKESRKTKYEKITKICFELFEKGLLPKEIIKQHKTGRDFTYRLYKTFNNK